MLLKLRVAEEAPRRLESVADCGILVATDVASDEANASAGILVARITKDVFQLCEQTIVTLGNYVPGLERTQELVRQAQAVVVLLSPGCMDSMLFLSIICELQQSQGRAAAPGAISVNITGFAFTSSAALEELCARHEKLALHYGNTCSDLLKSFFKNISIQLPTHASQDALDTQGDEIFRRIAQHVKGTRGTARGSSNGLPVETNRTQSKSTEGNTPSNTEVLSNDRVDVEVAASAHGLKDAAVDVDAGTAPEIRFEVDI
mmetsp:Transcript_49750/g.91835  ORF Transcript_49750/g.91835 Transcript_49750/m.91835 type:complete len:261 (-) Transcript_49750:93-875(-)